MLAVLMVVLLHANSPLLYRYDLATATWAHETGADEIMGHGKSLPDVLLVRKVCICTSICTKY